MSERLKKSYEVAVDYFCAIDHLVLSKSTDNIDRLQPFSYSGTVTVYYINGTHKLVENSACTFSGYNMQVAGDYTITVTYTERSKTITATYVLTVNKIWETIWTGWKVAYWGDTNSETARGPYYPRIGTGALDMEAIPETGTQQFRVTWQWGRSQVYSTNWPSSQPGLTWQPWCPFFTVGSTVIKKLNDYATSGSSISEDWSNFVSTHRNNTNPFKDLVHNELYDVSDEVSIDLDKADNYDRKAAAIQWMADCYLDRPAAQDMGLRSAGLGIIYNKETKKFELDDIKVSRLEWGELSLATQGFTANSAFNVAAAALNAEVFPNEVYCGLAVSKIEIKR